MNLNLNLKDFLHYLNRYKWWAITIPIVCVVITYFFVRDLPKKYISEALIATGLTRQAQRTSVVEGQTDIMVTNQQFDNLIQMMKSKRVINSLAYKLILHDLQTPQKPLTKYSSVLNELPAEKKQQAKKAFEKMYIESHILSSEDNKGDLKLFDIMATMKYDEGSIRKSLDVARSGQSDFIKARYTSANADLSAFVVNTFVNDFVVYYTNLMLSSQKQSLAILDTLLRQRQSEMSRKSAELAGSANAAAASAASALTQQRQSEMKLTQINEARAQQSQAVRNVNAIVAAIKEIDTKLAGGGGYLSNNSSQSNSQITAIDNQLSAANRRYVDNGFQPRDKASIDSLNAIKTRLLASSSGSSGGVVNQAAMRQELINQKIQLENQLASAKGVLNTIESQMALLGDAPSVSATPSTAIDGAQQVRMQDAQISANQYAQTQSQYDQIMLSAKAGSKLSVAEEGVPGAPESSKNILYLGFSYLSSLLIVLLTLFIAFMMNKTVNSPEQLETLTKHKVIGTVNFLPSEKDLREIWADDKVTSNEFSTYKDLIRSLRFELLEQLSDSRNMLGITSFKDGEGKTFVAGSLCYAFALMGKNVLFITDNDTTMMDIVSNENKKKAPGKQAFESFLIKREIQVEDRITILNRNSKKNSLLELRDNFNLATAFQKLKDTFDLVIVDVDSSEEMHKVKEWLYFCDKSIAIFEAGNSFTDGEKQFVKYLSKDPGFIGWILNKVKPEQA